jgi:hypothetical protein
MPFVYGLVGAEAGVRGSDAGVITEMEGGMMPFTYGPWVVDDGVGADITGVIGVVGWPGDTPTIPTTIKAVGDSTDSEDVAAPPDAAPVTLMSLGSRMLTEEAAGPPEAAPAMSNAVGESSDAELVAATPEAAPLILNRVGESNCVEEVAVFVVGVRIVSTGVIARTTLTASTESASSSETAAVSTDRGFHLRPVSKLIYRSFRNCQSPIARFDFLPSTVVATCIRPT